MTVKAAYVIIVLFLILDGLEYYFNYIVLFSVWRKYPVNNITITTTYFILF